MNDLAAFGFAAATSAAAVVALSSLALRAGLADDPAAAPHRKLQARPVPPVGGAAILIGLCALEASTRTSVLPSGTWLALILTFSLGVVDDRTRGGLPPFALLLGQSIVAAALVWSGGSLCAGLAVLIALNAMNTFDNADGAATALGILGLSCGSILLAAPLVGFLPFNVAWLSRRRDPQAYLGNSGSHVLGLLLVLDPVGRAALLLPVLDLLRLSYVRTAAGSLPWVGDRRHLAHRMQKAGLPPPLVALALAAVAAPAVLGAAIGTGLALAIGASGSSLLFVVAVLVTPRVE